jgi:hypothetical protein
MTPHSGFDPATGVCWHFNNKGYRAWYWAHQKTCPACSLDLPDGESARVGRCRSARQWFWTAGVHALGGAPRASPTLKMQRLPRSARRS